MNRFKLFMRSISVHRVDDGDVEWLGTMKNFTVIKDLLL